MAKQIILPKRLDMLSVEDKACTFRINIDILNEAFGVGRSMYVRAIYPDRKNTWFTGDRPEDKFYIWMAKLYHNSSEWKNSISDDGRTIYEFAEPTRQQDWTDSADITDYKRIVFLKDGPKYPYRFVGIFENENMEYLRHTYRRIATKVQLIGNPVHKISLLDDIR